MRRLFPLLFALLCIGFILYCFQVVGAEHAKEEGRDDSVVVTMYFGMIMAAAGLAIVIATTIVPLIAEWGTSMVYAADTPQEKGPYTDALVRLAQGDYHGAIEEYEGVLESNPEDTLALSEIVNIYADKLEDCLQAAGRLELALEHEWEPDKAAFLSFRLADIYWKYMHDGDRARAMLEQIVEGMPDTTHSANASHRLREIEHAEMERKEREFLAKQSEG
ncbi:MAG: tol-pal system YbgF family protein [Verrucomicrobiales bacterium]